MRVLVIGSGSIGRRHHENLSSLGVTPRLLSWREGGLSGALAAMAQADAVVIATATDIRLPLIEAAASRNLPLYIEKPLAFLPREVEAIAAATTGIADRSLLGYMMRYHPAFRILADQDRSDVFQFSFAIGHDVTQWRQRWRFSDSYAARAQGGGVLLDLCHEIDMACALFPGLSVTSVESLGHSAYPGVDMASRISLSNGKTVGEVAMDYLTPRLHRRAMLRGADGLRDFDFASQSYRIADQAGERQIDAPLERNAMFLHAMQDFLSLAAGKTPTTPHLPRLDLALPSARLVAEAWARRHFIGTIEKEIP